MSEVSKSDYSNHNPLEVFVQKAFENNHIRSFLRMNVLNFSQGLPEAEKPPLEEMLRKYMDSAARLALSAKIPEPDMSLPNWKENFDNALEDALLNNQEFTNLIAATKQDIKTKFPAIDNPMAFTDFPYMQMANDISQVAYMHSYNIDPKYVFLTPAEIDKERRRLEEIAKKAGKEVEYKPADDGKETIQ